MSASSESESNESVFNTVQKFEASKIIIKGPPLGPPPPVPEKPKNTNRASIAESEDLTDDDIPTVQIQALEITPDNSTVTTTDSTTNSETPLKVTNHSIFKLSKSPKDKSSSSPKKSKWKRPKLSKEKDEPKKVSEVTEVPLTSPVPHTEQVPHTDQIPHTDQGIANLSQVPRKSSMKKTKSLPQLEPLKPKLKGIWFKMGDQYPVENFSGRKVILEQIHNVVFGQKSRDARPISRAIVLAGKSGMGKTEIVRKFVFKFYTDCNGDGNVIWINASNRESIVNTLLYLHDKELMSTAGEELPPQSPLSLSQSRLQLNRIRKPKGSTSDEDDVNLKIQAILTNKIFLDNPTIFVFDNARNEEQIAEFIPQLPPYGHIPSVLVTSRNENWNNSRVFKVGEFEFNEAVEFLTDNFKKIPEFTRFQAEDLAKELHRFPPLLQRAKEIVYSYLHTGNAERALIRLEKNVGLVRRLKNEEVLQQKDKDLEIAVLSVDRGHFYEEDAYIREYDGELRSHPMAMQLHQLETILHHIPEREQLSVLAVNEDVYILSVLANLIGSRSKVLGLYDSETSSEFAMDHLTNCLEADNENLLKEDRIQVRLVDVPKAKTPIQGPIKQSKIVPVLDKWRSTEGKNQLYDVILTNIFSGQDLKPVKSLLKKGGRFITSMTSSDTSLILKKVNPKKLEVKMLKQDFPELVVVIRKL